MRLADFIERNPEPILSEWVAFAATSGAAGKGMDLEALRDHALDMLTTIVADLREPQTDAQQSAKAMGKGPDAPGGETAAEVHGAGRAESGFTVAEMVSEYRALRASVIRLWTREKGTLEGADLDDLMRFNESIDQSLAESIQRFSSDLDHAREIYVGILGHDLRTPLGAVIMATQFMLDLGDLEEPHLTLTTRTLRSARRMNQMVLDLLDFTRGRLGSGVPITRAPMDLGTVVRQAVDEMAAAEPEAVLRVTTSGDLHGEWDSARLSQVVTNLLGNAVQHGAAKSAIAVAVQGDGDDVVLTVHNQGAAIPASQLGNLFSPFKRLHGDAATSSGKGNLGLGLYIAERIVTAHGGTIDVRSTAEKGTEFRVRMGKR